MIQSFCLMTSNMLADSAISWGTEPVNGLYFSPGRFRPAMSQRSVNSIPLSDALVTWLSLSFRFLANTDTRSVGMDSSTTILTGNPMSLESRAFSTALIRSTASSTVTLTSAFLVMRNLYAPRTSRPGKRAPMLSLMMFSRRTNCLVDPPEGTLTNLGRMPTGTLTLA